MDELRGIGQVNTWRLRGGGKDLLLLAVEKKLGEGKGIARKRQMNTENLGSLSESGL